ncbi:MAG: type I-U CRISPR-associated protein Csx17, partial [Polyangiaceae bacterium]
MTEIRLPGCRPIPLAHYLKALGVLRLVGVQAVPDVLGHWRGEEFHLVSSLDERQLVEFFLQRYSPSPLVAPWNG